MVNFPHKELDDHLTNDEFLREESYTEKRLPMKCEDCSHEWEEVFSLPMIVDAFVARLRGTLCPKCGSKEASIVLNRGGADVVEP